MDIFGIDRKIAAMKEADERRERLRNLAFDTIKDSQEFLFKILGQKGSKEYWDWRLDFDLKRYNIKL